MTDAPYPEDDPNGVFPILDGIGPAGPSEVPSGFDLMAILSESMRARPPWRDFAATASRIVYEYVERVRLALQSSRDPAVLSRTLKIATLKMIGLDWTSTILTDDDYDRVLEAVAVFMKEKGPRDFARFIGYSLGVPMELVQLWSVDYSQFSPGSPLDGSSILTVPGGSAYGPVASFPTSHVDLLYEMFAPRASPIAGATAELTDLFYRIAPIHLVLDAIAAEVTLSIGNLYLALAVFQEGEETVLIENPSTAVLTTPGRAAIAAGTLAIHTAMVSSDDGTPTGQETGQADVVATVTLAAGCVRTGTVPGGYRVRVVLDTPLGPFAIGNVGLYQGGVLMALAPFPDVGGKVGDALPGQVGNLRTLVMDLIQ